MPMERENHEELLNELNNAELTHTKDGRKSFNYYVPTMWVFHS